MVYLSRIYTKTGDAGDTGLDEAYALPTERTARIAVRTRGSARQFLREITMVYLSRIYTKTGDAGDTGLGDGTRVLKDHPRVAAYGDVDELNCVFGLLLATCPALADDIASAVRDIQNDLFDVGADLCVPPKENEAPNQALRVRPDQATKLEALIDRYNESLQPLKSFVLPGGNPAAAWCHLARTVCRRAERAVVSLMRSETVNPGVLIYLNRLSDLLFVLGRFSNDGGQSDVLWTPGGKK